MDAGATCGAHVKASSEDELVAKVGDHLRKVHKVQNVSRTLQKYALKVARRS